MLGNDSYMKNACLLLGLTLSATSILSAITITADEFNFRPDGKIYPAGGDTNLGDIIVRPGFDLSNVTESSTTDFLFRWTNLDLDGSGGNDDYFDFTIRASSGTSDAINFNGQGIAIQGNGSSSLNAGEELTFQVVSVQLSPSTLGTVSFDGFTGAGFFASGNRSSGSTTASATGDVNGINLRVDINGTGYTWDVTRTSFASPASAVVFDNVVRIDGTVSPSAFARDTDLQFTFTPANPLPPHGITSDPETQDLDGNGFPDVWEAQYRAYGLTLNSDSDGDGLSNEQESEVGTDPFDPYSKMAFGLAKKDANTLTVEWTDLNARSGTVQSSTDLGGLDPWGAVGGVSYSEEGMLKLDVSTAGPATNFFRLQIQSDDLDSDGIADHLEPLFGFLSGAGNGNSAFQPQSYDTTGDGVLDTTISGDLAAYNEVYRAPQAGKKLTRAQAARLLLQTTFGPSDMSQVDYVASIGAEAWIDQQIALSPTYHQPYFDMIKADMEASPSGDYTNQAQSGYWINGGAGAGGPFVSGRNYTTGWIRATSAGPDQLRQRVAFALSQILVASRRGTGLFHQIRSASNYYDIFVSRAFGNFEDILLDVSMHPFMGNYLSHIGNQKADVPNGIYPDENYAREIMQLFSIGLWELYPDGTRILDGNGQPIETYDTTDITNVAEVFTGIHYTASRFGTGYRDDGDSGSQFMTTPMKAFGSHHDFSTKNIPIGIAMSGGEPVLDAVTGKATRLYHTIPARSQSDSNALQDVEDTVHQLVNHPNCAPFICRQLIQFLVSSNPSPGYLARVSAVFVDNGAGVTGDMEAVVKAILLDEEARNPMEHLRTPYFGHLREPVIRVVHLARMLEINEYDDLLWWFFEDYYAGVSLQEPMYSPSVFNFYRPDYSLFGDLSDNGLESPAFGIVNSYSAISFPNYLWKICEEGFNFYSGSSSWYNGKTFPPNLSKLAAIAGDIPDLLDHLSILYCGGTLGAQSRAIIADALEGIEQDRSISAGNKNTEKARLAAYLVLISPEGACTK